MKDIKELFLEDMANEKMEIAKLVGEATDEVETEESKAKKKELSDYVERIDKRAAISKESARRIALEIKEVLPTAGDQVNFLAHLLKEFNRKDAFESSWIVDLAQEHYLGLSSLDLIEPCLEIHKILVENGHSIKNRFDYNDMDNTLFYVDIDRDWLEDHEDRKVFGLHDQNFSWIIVIDLNEHAESRLHIRRFWPYPNFKDEPNLEWFRTCGFTMDLGNRLAAKNCLDLSYRMNGDGHDAGYILTTSKGYVTETKYNYDQVTLAITMLNHAVKVLKGEATS